MDTPWWVEVIVAAVVALPGIFALIPQIRKARADAKKTDADRENELIAISRKATADLIAQLESRIVSLHTAITELEGKCSGYEKRIDELEAEVTSKNDRIDELERSEASKDLRIKELEARVAELESLEHKN